MKLPKPGRAAPWRRTSVLAVLVLGCVVGGTIFVMWPRNDVPNHPDAVVVLGGYGVERTQLGIELSERYQATLVLSSSAINFAWPLGVSCDEDAVCVTPYPQTTAGEASTVAAITESHGWRHVTVATTRFHTTRARVLFRQCLGDRVTVVGAPPVERRSIGVYARETLGTLAALTVDRAC